ncbi:uncharacterized protein B0H18DRAFT_3454 [Fomitopsis serialis]|uniref:uncharacterized protein n=1 Tax=Fomitopsis serialis TaxID=139415 RepID=UPI0020083560|nr:uncharacterized protein B0H18DRAFT_3454 [Neoantrodia serialis]KAH9938107.1 hypothetical protein B0H18DRAFT_3454 [Neoantrodia serialis]
MDEQFQVLSVAGTAYKLREPRVHMRVCGRESRRSQNRRAVVRKPAGSCCSHGRARRQGTAYVRIPLGRRARYGYGATQRGSTQAKRGALCAGAREARFPYGAARPGGFLVPSWKQRTTASARPRRAPVPPNRRAFDLRASGSSGCRHHAARTRAAYRERRAARARQRRAGDSSAPGTCSSPAGGLAGGWWCGRCAPRLGGWLRRTISGGRVAEGSESASGCVRLSRRVDHAGPAPGAHAVLLRVATRPG